MFTTGAAFFPLCVSVINCETFFCTSWICADIV